MQTMLYWRIQASDDYLSITYRVCSVASENEVAYPVPVSGGSPTGVT